MTSEQDQARKISDQLVTKYGMQVPKETAYSIFIGQPRIPVLLSRTSFRSNKSRPEPKMNFQRRHFLRNMIGLVGVSVIGLIVFKTISIPNAQTATTSPSQITSTSGSQIVATTSQTVAPSSLSNPTINGGQLLANASNIPLNESLILNDPSMGPIVLIHLNSGRFVAYSTICTHAGCQVQFDPSSQDLICPCHGAVYDPNNNAQVLAGPAPYPLQKVPIQYDSSTGNIYLAA